MTFALVAYLLITGTPHAFVLEDGLSIASCNAMVREGVTAATDNAGALVDLRSAALVCELES